MFKNSISCMIKSCIKDLQRFALCASAVLRTLPGFLGIREKFHLNEMFGIKETVVSKTKTTI